MHFCGMVEPSALVNISQRRRLPACIWAAVPNHAHPPAAHITHPAAKGMLADLKEAAEKRKQERSLVLQAVSGRADFSARLQVLSRGPVLGTCAGFMGGSTLQKLQALAFGSGVGCAAATLHSCTPAFSMPHPSPRCVACSLPRRRT